MYLYFNSQGVLKEIINDEAIRQGNSNINKIKFFIEGADPQVVNNVYKAITFITGVRTFVDVEGKSLDTEAFSLTTITEEIPYDKKRELKFFKYFTKYEMFSITVPDDILNESGTVGCRVQMVSSEGIITLGLILFDVEITSGGDAIIQPDTAINIAQWNYLISNMLTPEKYVVKYDEDADEWDIIPTENSHKPVTSGGVYTAIANALSTVYKIMGSTTVTALNDLTKSASMNGYVYNMTGAGTLTNSTDTTSVQEGDNVVFVWNEGTWYWDRLSGLVDTSNLVTLNTDQTVTSEKTIKDKPISFYYTGATGDAKWHIEENNYGCLAISRTYNNIKTTYWEFDDSTLNPHTTNVNNLGSSSKVWSYIYVNNLSNGSGDITSHCNFKPSANNSLDLGTSALYWKDLYLSGKYYLGSNKYVYLDSSNRIVFSNNGDRLKIDASGNVWFVASAIPLVTSTYDLGSSSNYWKDLYFTGNISDGANTVSVANIGKKIYQHNIATGVMQESLIIVCADDTEGDNVQDIDLHLISGGTLISMYVIDVNGLVSPVIKYEVSNNGHTLTAHYVNISGGTLIASGVVINDSDTITDVTTAIN